MRIFSGLLAAGVASIVSCLILKKKYYLRCELDRRDTWGEQSRD